MRVMGMRRRLWLGVAATLPLIGLAITGGGVVPAGAVGASSSVNATTTRTTGLAAGNPFCKELGKRYWASAGAHMFCFGRQPNGRTPRNVPVRRSAGTLRNVDAASLAEDVSPAGVRAYGQSETSIAASGPYVAEEWNDS